MKNISDTFTQIKQMESNEISFDFLISQMKFISVGRVVKVFSRDVVYVEKLVTKNSVQAELFTIKLVYIMSKLNGVYNEPLEGDFVLMFFLDGYVDGMFTSSDPIHDPDAPSNSKFSGIGLLIGVADRIGAVNESTWRDSDKANIEKNYEANVVSTFRDKVATIFNAIKKVTHTIAFGKNDGLELSFEKDVAMRFHDNAPLSVEGNNTFTASFKKAVVVKTDDGFELKAEGDVVIGGKSIKISADKISAEATEKVVIDSQEISFSTPDSISWKPNIIPVCPFGINHGGIVAGITKLNGNKDVE